MQILDCKWLCFSWKHFSCGAMTDCRIKKLIDLEALGLSQLSVLLIDLHVDVKGYSLLTLPQLRYLLTPSCWGRLLYEHAFPNFLNALLLWQ